MKLHFTINGKDSKTYDTTEMYHDWVNNFLSIVKFAEHYGISERLAERVISAERQLNDLVSDFRDELDKHRYW